MSDITEPRVRRWDPDRDGEATEEVVLEAGDRAEVPAGTRHTAEVLGGEPVVSLDATR